MDLAYGERVMVTSKAVLAIVCTVLNAAAAAAAASRVLE
jgi:hypothetical protein